MTRGGGKLPHCLAFWYLHCIPFIYLLGSLTSASAEGDDTIVFMNTDVDLWDDNRVHDLKNLTYYITKQQELLRIPPWQINQTALQLYNVSTYEPVAIRVQVAIEAIHKLDEVKMEMSMSFILNLGWNDTRLALNERRKPLVLPEHLTHMLWQPDITVQSSKKYSTTVDNHVMRVGKFGDISYAVKISATITCQMHLSTFPMDRQTCKLSLYSFGYYADEFLLFWDEFPNIFYEHSIDTLTSFYLEHYATTVHNIAYCSTNGTICRSKNFLTMEFEFKRHFLSVFFISYLPATVMVILGGLSTYVDPSSTPARVGMSVTTVLTISTVIQGLKNQLPSVSYLTALDVYLWACFFFLSSTLVEYAYLNYVTVILPHYKMKMTDDEQLDTFIGQKNQKTRKMSMTEGLRYRNFNKNLNGSMRDNSISSLCYYDMDSYGQDRCYSAKTVTMPNGTLYEEENSPGMDSLESIDSGLDKDPGSENKKRGGGGSSLWAKNAVDHLHRVALSYKDRYRGDDGDADSDKYRDDTAARISTSSKEQLLSRNDSSNSSTEKLTRSGLELRRERQSRREWNEQMKNYRRELDIDRKFRIFYTGGFVLFNALYWFYYLQLSKHE